MAIISIYGLAMGFFITVIVIHVVRTIHSVCFGPLAKFPGPRLAAATSLYEFYYDIICGGQYPWKIKELHGLYGPIIRINPYELHIDEPDYYQELYSTNEPRNKYIFIVSAFGLPESGFSTIEHRLHRIRRAAMNPFFSKQSINKLESMLMYMTEKVCKRITEYRDSGQPVPTRRLYMCLTTDVISLYAMNRSWNFLDDPDLSPLWFDTMKPLITTAARVKWMPALLSLIEAIPIEYIEKMDPGIGLLMRFREKIKQDTQAVIDGDYKYTQEQHGLGMDKTIFHELLDSNLPPEEKLHSRIWQEGQAVIAAGSETTANTLDVIHFHLLDNPEVWKKLREELEIAMPDKFTTPRLSVVEHLPYLSAVVQEGLRISYGVTSRLPRAHPTEVMMFHEWAIPLTPVSMTSVHIHDNESIFPEPKKFKPERWLEPRPEGAPPLDRYLVSFSKGSRKCIGMNLARAEIYVTVAAIFRRFENQELFESSRLDVDCKYDVFVPQPDVKSKGLKVLFK